MIWIILGIIVVLVLIVVGVYNGLVKSRMQTREAWSQIDVQLTSIRNFVFCVGQFFLQLHEVGVGFQVWVIFSHRKDACYLT